MNAAFEDLCSGICAHIGAPAPQLLPDDHGIVGFSFALDDLSISIVQRPCDPASTAHVLAEFGALPTHCSGHAWAHLLHTNFLTLGANAPVFSRNPHNGEALLQWPLKLQNCDPAQLMDRLRGAAALARRWQTDGLMPPDPRPSPAREARVFG